MGLHKTVLRRKEEGNEFDAKTGTTTECIV
jgi:hypothetical protein